MLIVAWSTERGKNNQKKTPKEEDIYVGLNIFYFKNEKGLAMANMLHEPYPTQNFSHAHPLMKFNPYSNVYVSCSLHVHIHNLSSA